MAHSLRSVLQQEVLVICVWTLLILVGGTEGQTTWQSACGPYSSEEQRSSPVCDYCFEDKCKCCGVKADCSGNYGNLTFIPKFPEEVLLLDFSKNRLGKSYLPENAFENITSVTALDLSDNGLIYLRSVAFEKLRNLTWLCLQENPDLRSNSIQDTFHVPSLEYLSIMVADLRIMLIVNNFSPSSNVRRLHLAVSSRSSPNNVALDFMDRNFPVLEDFLMSAKSNPETLRMSITPPLNASDLRTLNLSSLGISEFPATCIKGNYSRFPSLTTLNISNNRISALPRTVCLPELQLLDLTSSLFHNFETDMFSHRKFPHLYVLLLDTVQSLSAKVQQFAFQNRALKTLSLQNQTLQFGQETVHPESFGHCPNLTELDLSDNNFTGVVDGKFQVLFGNLANLQFLRVDNAEVDTVTASSFSKLQSLQQLSLKKNKLTTLPQGFVDSLRDLKGLDLRDNRISVMRDGTFDAASLDRLRLLDLRENPLICSCDLLWFRDWLRVRVSFNLSRDFVSGHECSNIRHVKVMDYDLDYQACLAQPWVYKAVLASATVLISICVVAVLLRLRKRIHRAFQNVFWRQIYRDLLDFHHGRNRKPPLQAQENTQYDLYVSYASEDEDWVLAHLIPELEGRLGKKLCIHERDFVPGKNIIGNIVDCMETSKRLMMLFSTAFAHSDWCQYELTLALNYAMERDESLVVAILDEIDPKDLSPAMKAVLSTFTYVEWQREPFLQAGPGFWDRLETAMQEAETVL